MQEQQSLTFKVRLGEEIRRFSVPASAQWEDIIQKLCTIFAIGKDEKLLVKYEDDEKELITIDSTAELQEVKKIYGTQCIRLEISKTKINLSSSFVASPLPTSDRYPHHKDSDYKNKCKENKKEWKNKSGKSWCPRTRYCQNKWQRKGCHEETSVMSSEELTEKLHLLEEKGFKCKYRNIRLLKMNNGDVDKVCDILVEHKNKKFRCDYSEQMKSLFESGFEQKGINLRLLKHFDGNVDKVKEILIVAKQFEESKGYNHPWFTVKLLLKFNGDLNEVDKVWQKKQERMLQKSQKCREKKVEKAERKMKKEDKKAWKRSYHSRD